MENYVEETSSVILKCMDNILEKVLYSKSYGHWTLDSNGKSNRKSYRVDFAKKLLLFLYYLGSLVRFRKAAVCFCVVGFDSVGLCGCGCYAGELENHYIKFPFRVGAKRYRPSLGLNTDSHHQVRVAFRRF